MTRVNDVIQEVSQLNTYEQGKVFEFLKTVLTSNGMTNSTDEEIAENRFNKGKCCPFCNHDKISKYGKCHVRMVLNKGLNVRMQSAKELSMIFLSLLFQAAKKE